MDQSEAVAAKWLRSEGHEFRHLTGGDDPPDFVVDDNIAVEVTTISTYAYRSISHFFNNLFHKFLGNAENGRGYAVSIEYEDERMFEVAGVSKKEDLRRLIRQELKAHYRNPNSGIRPNGSCVIPLLHGITLEIWPWQSSRDYPVEYKYTVCGFKPFNGEIFIQALVENIQAAIDKKSAKQTIQARVADYREWWLVVTGFRRLDQDESKILSDMLVLREPWKHLIAVNSPTQISVLKSREDGNSDGF